jgi:predicted amidohydrolase
MSTIKIALCQMLVEGGEPKRNLDRASSYIEIASKKKCDLIIFPECSDLGWTHPSVFYEAEKIPGKWSNQYCKLSKKFNISICIGLTEKYKNKIYNSAIYIENGIILNKHRKINELEIATKFYSCGNKVEVFKTEIGNCGISICSDNYDKSKIISHLLARMQADFIVSPCSWTVGSENTKENPYLQKWVPAMKEVTQTYKNVFVAVTSVGYIVGGPYEGKKMIGQSLAYQNGKCLKIMSHNEISTEFEIIKLNFKKENRLYGTKLSESVTINI